jgi:hypothetical protein
VFQSEAAPQQQRFENDLREVFDAGQGCLTLTVIGDKAASVLVAAVMDGDAFAKAVLHAADRLLRKIHRRSHGNALTCMLCDDNAMWRGEPPGAVGVLTPFGIVPVRVAVGMGICSACAADRAELDLAHAAVARFRCGLMPDLRVMSVMAEAGHA